MTVTKRKQKPRETGGTDPTPSGPPTIESGIKASCDSCSADITHSVHIRCAEFIPNHPNRLTCPDFDLCVDCFLHGKSLGPHRPSHAYRVISSHSFPIFNALWGADEELLLIEGAQMYGLGNWADIAEHVGGRTKEECMEHYYKTYLESQDWPLPRIETNFSPTDVDTFATLKKRRLEDLQSRPLPLPPPKPLASAPTCHEIGGYMPGRLEFEHEYENEAEVLIKDMEFGKVYHFGGADQPEAPTTVVPPTEEEKKKKEEDGDVVIVEGEDKKPGRQAEQEEEEVVLPEGDREGDEPEAELELKLTVLEMFNERYDKRMSAKDLIFDRGLINYKTLAAAERKRSKDERDLITRTKVFARIQTSRDHEEFVDGLLYEIALRKRITELQEYRRNGITTLSESERFEGAKSARLNAKAASYRDSVALSFDRSVGGGGGSSTGGQQSRRVGGGGTPGLNGSVSGGGGGGSGSGSYLVQLKNRPQPPLTLATADSLHLLTPLERQLCSTLRMLPKPYLFLKEVLLRESVRIGVDKMRGREAKLAVIRDEKSRNATGIAMGGGEEEELSMMGEWGEKIERVWEFLRESSGFRERRRNGTSTMLKRRFEDVEDEREDESQGTEDVEMEMVRETVKMES